MVCALDVTRGVLIYRMRRRTDERDCHGHQGIGDGAAVWQQGSGHGLFRAFGPGPQRVAAGVQRFHRVSAQRVQSFLFPSVVFLVVVVFVEFNRFGQQHVEFIDLFERQFERFFGFVEWQQLVGVESIVVRQQLIAFVVVEQYGECRFVVVGVDKFEWAGVAGVVQQQQQCGQFVVQPGVAGEPVRGR